MSTPFRVVWTDVALNDLLSIVDYIADRHGAGAAEDFARQITGAVETLQTMPQRCRVGDAVVLAALDGRRDLAELLVERALRRA